MSGVLLVFIYYMVSEVLGEGSPSPEPEESGTTFFNNEEKEWINEYCRQTDVLNVLAEKVKDSLIARGIFHANITEKEVLSNKKFMKFLTDIVRLNIKSGCKYGTVIFNGKSYPICSDFELSDEKMKPQHWKKLKPALFSELPNGVVEKFIQNRINLLKKLVRDCENLVNHMGFVKPVVKDTPTKEAESRESVQGRVNEFMVRLFDMY